MNTTQVKRPKIEYSNLKMDDFDTIEKYIEEFKNQTLTLLKPRGEGKSDLEQ